MINIKLNLKSLISNGNTDAVINDLKTLPIDDKDLSDNIILISAKYNRYSIDLLKNILDMETASTEINKINNLLLQIIDKLPDNLIDLIIDQIQKEINKFLSLREKTNNPDDYVEIFEILNKYKDKEFFSANHQEILAFLYKEGWGTKKNMNIAFELYKKSAKSNWGWGQWGLANMYFDQGDYNSCMIWLRKAADNNVNIAFLKIGDMYRDGIGVEINSNKAMEYYLKAAFREVDWGYICLGDLFYDGTETIDKDKYLAKLLYKRVSDNIHAKKRLDSFID